MRRRAGDASTEIGVRTREAERRWAWISIRINLLLAAFLVILLFLAGRAYQLQVMSSQTYRDAAREQYFRQIELTPSRGTIYDRKMGELAVSVPVDSIAVDPSKVEDVTSTAKALAKDLGLAEKIILDKLQKESYFVWIKRRVGPEEAKPVRARKLKGVVFVQESRRYYPNRQLAANLLGFVGLDSKGLSGLEMKYDSMLRGKTHVVEGLRDAKGNLLLPDGFLPSQFLEGYCLVLALDSTIQHLAEKYLAEAVQENRAAAGWVVVMDPRNGEILALAVLPTYDPNNYLHPGPAAWRNRAITDTYEPGSTLKAVVMAAALDQKLVKPDGKIHCENGAMRIGRRVIHDSHPHGLLTATQVMQVSSNIGMTKIARLLGKEGVYSALVHFGFGRRSRIDLVGEASGLLWGHKSWSEIGLANHAFGQGVAVTALQLTSAFSTIANGGKRMRPRLVREMRDRDGRLVQSFPPVVVSQVISPEAAQMTTEMLKTVVQPGGTAIRAAVEGYAVAGKTGTAQKADPVYGGYSPDKRVSSFVGFVPADDPCLAISVIIDEPKGKTYGGLVAAPAFRKIALESLRYLGVTPDPALAAKAVTMVESREVAQEEEPGAIYGSLQAHEAKSGSVPDFAGLTIVRALALASDVGLELIPEGSGVAVSQSPPPGTPLGSVARCTVTFSLPQREMHREAPKGARERKG